MYFAFSCYFFCFFVFFFNKGAAAQGGAAVFFFVAVFFLFGGVPGCSGSDANFAIAAAPLISLVSRERDSGDAANFSASFFTAPG